MSVEMIEKVKGLLGKLEEARPYLGELDDLHATRARLSGEVAVCRRILRKQRPIDWRV